MTQKERMLLGFPYRTGDLELKDLRMEAKKKIYDFNHLRPDEEQKVKELMYSIIGKSGTNLHIKAPFYCEYGTNIEIGDNFFSNFNCMILDAARVSIGNNVRFAPNVCLYTSGHPLHPESRNSGYEYAKSITIGDNVWIGGNTVVNPGITIGNNTVIGSGSVVTKNIPDNVLAFGNPCKVIRSITDKDRDYYFKDQKFDVEDY